MDVRQDFGANAHVPDQHAEEMVQLLCRYSWGCKDFPKTDYDRLMALGQELNFPACQVKNLYRPQCEILRGQMNAAAMACYVMMEGIEQLGQTTSDESAQYKRLKEMLAGSYKSLGRKAWELQGYVRTFVQLNGGVPAKLEAA